MDHNTVQDMGVTFTMAKNIIAVNFSSNFMVSIKIRFDAEYSNAGFVFDNIEKKGIIKIHWTHP